MQHTASTLVQLHMLTLLCLSSTDVTSPILRALVCILWGRVGNSYTIRKQTGSVSAELAWRGVLFGQHTCSNFLFNWNAFRQIVHYSINLVPTISTLLHFWSLAWWACLRVCDLQTGSLLGPLLPPNALIRGHPSFLHLKLTCFLLSPRICFQFFLDFSALFNVFVQNPVL